MKPESIESQLHAARTRWPVESIADRVARQIENEAVASTPIRSARRWLLTLAGSLLMLVVSTAFIMTVMMGNSSTLYAQLKSDIERSRSVHIKIIATDETAKKTTGDIWYERGQGFRMESADEIVVESEGQQWSWNPAVADAERIVLRRQHRGAAIMVADSLHLEAIPRDWKKSPMPEFDRDLNGIRCEAQKIEPNASSGQSLALSGSRPMRIVVWTDSQKRVVLCEEQRLSAGEWRARREMTIEYDVEVATDKFTTSFAKDTKIVDADAIWSSRFPVEAAIVTSQSEGLQFAVHEFTPCEEEMYYVVSSVRGTQEYLASHPSTPRPNGWSTSIPAVAAQIESPNVQQECHAAILSTCEENGVQYVWWIAIPRKYFQLVDGKPAPMTAGKPLEFEPGRVRLPLQANLRDGSRLVSTHVELEAKRGVTPATLERIAGLARRDAKLATTPGRLYGSVKNFEVQTLNPNDVNDAEYAEELQSQLDWLRSFDKLSVETMGATVPGK
jgi:hypothetical protein